MEYLILLPYQMEKIDEAVNICRDSRLVYLAMETRTGKTPISLMVAARLSWEYRLPPYVLFATKKSVIPSIKDTLNKLRRTYPVMTEIDVEIVSFDSLHKIEYAPRVMIIDEAHSFGAYPRPTKRANDLRKLTKNNVCILLSATPTPESYSQIYHQLWACNSSSPLIAGYKNFYAWARDYVSIKKKIIGANQTVNDYSAGRIDLIQPYLRRITVTQTQAGSGFKYPEHREIIYWVDTPNEIKDYTKRLKKDKVVTIAGYQVVADTAVKLLAKLHQLYSGTVIPEGQDTGIIVSMHKINAVRHIAKLYKRIAVYYTFIAEREMLMSAFGGQITEDWQEFADGDKIFIGQYVSKREGIDLKDADTIVLFTPHFAYLSYIQTLNRMQHIYRDKPALLIWVFCRNGIEEKIYDVVKRKENFTTSHFRKIKKELA